MTTTTYENIVDFYVTSIPEFIREHTAIFSYC